ncbi:MAG: hypothetical protein IPL61_17290 [Myxococcales bacterium]|nr:hypothetical protein [Myxococcales bacterium]
MLTRVRAAIPPALLVMIILTMTTEVASALYQAHVLTSDREVLHAGRWEAVTLATMASWFTLTLLVFAGLRELAARLRGTDRTLVTLAAVVAGLAMLRPLISLYLEYVDMPGYRWTHSYHLWSARISFGLWLGAAGCLAAVVGRRGPRGVAIAVALVVTTVIMHPLRTISGWMMFDYGPAHVWANAALSIAYDLAGAAALGATVFVLGDRASPPQPAPDRIVHGLERTGAALVARVVIALGAAAFTVMAVGARSPGLLKLMVTVVPVALLAAMIAQISGMFAAGAAGTGPRLRFVGAAALSTWALVATSCQAVAAFRVARDAWSRGSMDSWDRQRLAATATAWPYLVPLVGMVGLLLLLSAVASVRRARPSLDASAPALAGVWLVTGTMGALLLQRWALSGHVRGIGEFMMLTIVVAVANIVATVAVARACHKTAWALMLDEPSALPTARALEP